MQKSETQTQNCCGSDCCMSSEEIVLMNPDIKDQIRKQYGSIALGESQACCGPECCAPDGAESSSTSATTNSSRSPKQATQMMGYSSDDLQAIPEASILGVGCGAPHNF